MTMTTASPATNKKSTMSGFPSELSVSSVGRRERKLTSSGTLPKNKNAMKETTDLVLRDLVDRSAFFAQNPSRTLPRFDPSVVETGCVLGTGEFGIVLEIKCLRVSECGCPPGGGETLCCKPHLELQLSSVSSITVVPKSIAFASHAHERTASAVTFVGDDEKKVNVTQTQSTAEDNQSDENEEHAVSDDDELSNPTVHEPEEEMERLRQLMASHSQREGQSRYALKRLKDDLAKDPRKNVEIDAAIDLACEAKFLASISHSNIIRLRGTVGEPGNSNFCIVMDRLILTLEEKLPEWQRQNRLFRGKLGGLVGKDRKGQMQLFADRLLATFDIARAMRHLHHKKILYRDLKPDNIGFDVRGDVRIFDFGLARELKPKDLVETPDQYDVTGLTGSRRYMAPEVVRCMPYGFSADVYSFAILFWQVLALKLPFPDYDAAKHYDRVVSKGQRPAKVAGMPPRLQKLMQSAWAEDPRDRPTFADICQTLQKEITDIAGETTVSIDDRSNFLSDRSITSLNNNLVEE